MRQKKLFLHSRLVWLPRLIADGFSFVVLFGKVFVGSVLSRFFLCSFCVFVVLVGVCAQAQPTQTPADCDKGKLDTRGDPPFPGSKYLQGMEQIHPNVFGFRPRIRNENDKEQVVNLYKVSPYSYGITYMAGGATSATAGFGSELQNLLIRVQKLENGSSSQEALNKAQQIDLIPYKIRDGATTIVFPKQELCPTSFGGTGYARQSLLMGVSVYPRRLVRKNYPNSATKIGFGGTDTVYGFLLSRRNDNASGWADSSYIYRFRDRIGSNCRNNNNNGVACDHGFDLYDGGPKCGGVSASNALLANHSSLPSSEDKSADAMADVLAVDTNRAWAVGKGKIKYFNGTSWLDCSAGGASGSVPSLAGIQLSAVAGRFENPKDDCDTVYIVGQKSTFVRVIYGNQANANNCLGCAPAAGSPCANCTSTTGGQTGCAGFCVHTVSSTSSSSNTASSIGTGLPTDGDTNFTSVTAVGDTVWIASNKGGIYKSVNGGVNFTKDTLPQVTLNGGTVIEQKDIPFTSVHFVDAHNGWAVAGPVNLGQNQLYFRYSCACGTPDPKCCKWRQYSPPYVDNRISEYVPQSVAFSQPNAGFVVGKGGLVHTIYPGLSIYCSEANAKQRIQDWRNFQPPPNRYHLSGFSSPYEFAVNLCSADVLRCESKEPEKNKCDHWHEYYPGLLTVGAQAKGMEDCGGYDRQSACPAAAAGKRRYTDVYAHVYVETQMPWWVKKIPANLELSLTKDTTDESKSPKYTAHQVEDTAGKLGYKMAFPKNLDQTGNGSVQTSYGAFIVYDTVGTDAPFPAFKSGTMDTFFYKYAKTLKPFEKTIAGPVYPQCDNQLHPGPTTGANSYFRLRVRPLAVNFSLSPQISKIEFGVGDPDNGETRILRVYRPGLQPFFFAPERTLHSYGKRPNGAFNAEPNGFKNVYDSFVQRTNTGFRISVSTPNAYDIKLNNIDNKITDTPILRQWDKYDTLAPMHDSVTVNIFAKWNYVNSFRPAEDTLFNTILGPCYDSQMRPDYYAQRPLCPYHPSVWHLPPVDLPQPNSRETLGLEGGIDLMNDKSVLSFLPKLKPSTAVPNCASRGTIDEELLSGKVRCVLNYLSTLPPKLLPTARFPNVKRTKIVIRRNPFELDFEYKGVKATLANISDSAPGPDGKLLPNPEYNQRWTATDRILFSADGRPKSDSLFFITADARYEYDVRSGFDLSMDDPQAKKKYNVSRFSYNLMKREERKIDANAKRGRADTLKPKAGKTIALDSLNILWYDTAHSAQSAKYDADTILWGRERHAIKLRVLKENYSSRVRVDTIYVQVEGYEGVGQMSVSSRRIGVFLVEQEGARLGLRLSGRGGSFAGSATVKLRHGVDSASKFKPSRDSVDIFSSVKWYLKTSRKSSSTGGGSSAGGSSCCGGSSSGSRSGGGAYGQHFGEWYDTLSAVSWEHLSSSSSQCDGSSLGVPEGYLTQAKSGGSCSFSRGYVEGVHPYVVVKATQANLTGSVRRDSLEFCTLDDSVCRVVYIEQDKGEFVWSPVDRPGFEDIGKLMRGGGVLVDYRLGDKASFCLSSDGVYKMELPKFLKLVKCEGGHGFPYHCASLSSGSLQNASLCDSSSGVYPTYDGLNCAPPSGSYSGSVHKFVSDVEAWRGECRRYCVEVADRNESKRVRHDSIKVWISGTFPRVELKIPVVQRGISFDFSSLSLFFPRRPIDGMRVVEVGTSTGWQARGYDKSRFVVRPSGSSRVGGLYRKDKVEVGVLRRNEGDLAVRDTLLFVPLDVCVHRREALSGRVLLVQDSFWLHKRLVRGRDVKYPLESGVGEYSIPAEGNNYLWFYVEANAPWLAGVSRGGRRVHWIERPSGGFSALDADSLSVHVEPLLDFFVPREDSVLLYVVDSVGHSRYKDVIRYRQLSFDFGEENVVVYPNPVLSLLRVRSVHGDKFRNGYVYIYDIGGSLIGRRRYTDGLVDFDFGTLPVGVYILRIYDGKVSVTKKIIRQ